MGKGGEHQLVGSGGGVRDTSWRALGEGTPACGLWVSGQKHQLLGSLGRVRDTS